MTPFEIMMNRLIESDRIDVVTRDDSYLLRVKVFGTWVSIASLTKRELKDAQA